MSKFSSFKKKAEERGLTMEELFGELAKKIGLKKGDVIAVGGIPYPVQGERNENKRRTERNSERKI